MLRSFLVSGSILPDEPGTVSFAISVRRMSD
jgi:hypothetical protein